MSGTRPLLLFLVTEDWYFVTHRLSLARAAVRAGFRVAVACRTQAHGEVIRGAGCEVIEFPMARRTGTPLGEAGTLLRLAGLYRRERPALLHHVALKPALYGSLAARLAGGPPVVNAIAGLGHLFTDPSTRTRVLRGALVPVLRAAWAAPSSRFILQNPDDVEALVRLQVVRRDRITLLPGVGVNLTAFRPAPEPPGEPVVVLPARMLRAKGVETFVAAARLLRADGVPGRFVLAGREDPGNPTAIPVSELAAWTAEGVVQWVGHQEDVAGVLRGASVVCLPSSYGEGIPKVLLEAAATGRPLVATDVPGCREVVRPGVNGELVAPNQPSELSTVLRKLLLDASLRAKYGRASRALAEAEFGEDAVIDATLRLYRDLLGDRFPAG